MKTYINLSLLAFALILFSGQTQAQKIKFGHSNTNEIFELMPEAKEAEKALKKEQEKIQERIKAMQNEYQRLIQEYTENEQLVPQSPEKWSTADKADKEAAIRSLEQRITRYQTNAQSSLQEKQSEFYSPILEKIEKAIEKVRKDNGYTIIFDDNTLLSFDKEAVTNVNPMVKKELGLTE